MSCPPDVNTGLIQLVGPIQPSDVNNITVNSYPLLISFAPRTTFPSLIGNRIDESTDNTCTYRGNRFYLVDVQICSVTHKGYHLPGLTSDPVAELILSFSSGGSLSGLLLCVPIFDSGSSSHSAYLNQLIDDSVAGCNYTTQSGYGFTPAADNQTIGNATLSSCVKTCCNDPQCISYMYGYGTCTLANSQMSILNQGNGLITSGTIDRSKPQSCSGVVKDSTALIPTLQSIFYETDTDTSQISLGYKTCFETMTGTMQSHSLAVFLFPNGIHLLPASYQQLLLQMNGTLPPFMLPPAIRDGEATVQSYSLDDNGHKIATEVSQDGILYTTPLSTCSDEFKNRFEYFTKPPSLPVKSSKKYKKAVEAFTDCHTTSQYKCVPFDQLRDLSGEYVVLGSNPTLKSFLPNANESMESGDTGINWTSVGVDAGIVVLFGIIALYVGSKLSNDD